MTTALADQIEAGLADFPAEERRRIAGLATPLAAPAGATLFAPGDACERFFIVLEGQARVEIVTAAGREIVLYRVAGGETCLMTTACLAGGADYRAFGIVERDILAAAISPPAFATLLDESPAFRRFILTTFGERFSALMAFVEEITMRRIDQRLARHLVALAGDEATIVATHAQLASELGSVREVISRMLKDFEHSGLVALSRGQVTITDPAALARLANSG